MNTHLRYVCQQCAEQYLSPERHMSTRAFSLRRAGSVVASLIAVACS
jgi:predicted HicB family RNase H-like nuclease